MRSSVWIAFVVAGVMAWAAPARAFDEPSQFFASPDLPHLASLSASAEGIYFTGAPRFSGLYCNACHTNGPQKIGLKIGADPVSLFTEGYQPGRTYELEVELTDEQAGILFNTPTCTEPVAKNDKYTYVPCNNNSFALEIDDDSAPLAGASVFCAQPPLAAGVCPMPDNTLDEITVAPDGDAVFGNRQHSSTAGMTKTVVRNGPLRWHLWWTAPKAGTGPLTLYVAGVDGNGGAGTTLDDQDPLGDDTVQAAVPIREAGGTGQISPAAGCAVAQARGGGEGTTVVVVLVVAVVGLWLAGRRFSERQRQMRGR